MVFARNLYIRDEIDDDIINGIKNNYLNKYDKPTNNEQIEKDDYER